MQQWTGLSSGGVIGAGVPRELLERWQRVQPVVGWSNSEFVRAALERELARIEAVIGQQDQAEAAP